jgi:protein N-terminal methyltransferase
MWSQQLQGDVNDPDNGWYGKAISYWSKVPPTIDGVLGGLPEVAEVDVKESKKFIEAVRTVGRVKALDCGAGIGRLTKTLILPLGFGKVDVIEPLPHMLEQARKDIDPAHAGEFMQVPMQQAKLAPCSYDLIVIQWAAIYLTDDDFVNFLRHCAQALRPGGIVFFKENCTGEKTKDFVVDCDDSSLTRSDAHYKLIFARAGVTLVKEEYQKAWPKNLFPVKMYALGASTAATAAPAAAVAATA